MTTKIRRLNEEFKDVFMLQKVGNCLLIGSITINHTSIYQGWKTILIIGTLKNMRCITMHDDNWYNCNIDMLITKNRTKTNAHREQNKK